MRFPRAQYIPLALLMVLSACGGFSMPDIKMPEMSMPKINSETLLGPAPIKETPEQTAARVKELIKIVDVKPTGPYAINVIFKYVGKQPLKKLTLEAYYNNLNFPAYVEGPIDENDEFLARFKDPLIDTYTMDFTRLSWGVKEAVELEKGYIRNYGGEPFPSRHR